MLNDEQSRYYDRAKKLLKFLLDNKQIWEKYKPFAKWVTQFQADLAAVESFIPQKDASGKSATEIKNDLKTKVANEGADVCTIARSYALDISDASLAASMNYKATTISKLKEGDILGFAKNIHDTLTPLLPDPVFQEYDITAIMLDQLLSDAQAFDGMIGSADVVDSGSSVANKNIDTTFKAIDNDIVHFDLLINYFKKKAANFYAGYHINSAIDNSGIHHSGIEGTVTTASAGEPLQNARIVLLGTTKSAITDLLGHYQLIRVDTGDYKVEVSAAGYTTKTIIIHIYRGRISKLDFTL